MKKCKVVLVNLAVLAFCMNAKAQAAEPVWEDLSGGNSGLESILIAPDDQQVIYLGSKSQGVLKSEDRGANWKNILLIRGVNREVSFLLKDARNKNYLYATTGNGLYVSVNAGRSWKRIFKGKNNFEIQCTTIAILPGAIFLGTKAGLFTSNDSGRSWNKQQGSLGRSRILSIACNYDEPDFIYVACVDGAFRSKDSGKSWERIFVAHPLENTDDFDSSEEDSDEEEKLSDMRFICLDQSNTNIVYLATAKGIMKSSDKGLTWRSMSSYGLLSRDVGFMLVSDKGALYAAAKSGIFTYKDERWQELSFGLSAQNVNFLALDKNNNLYAACDTGLFKIKQDNFERGLNFKTSYSDQEPRINEVQQAAIKYAEVEPEKITSWREKVAKKAIMPKLTIGINRDTSDLWHWETGSSTKCDDDVLIRGNDAIDWDVTLSWDLGDLVWSEAQTSIDVRSRLMVELRDDILDEVNKLYFERLRVKLDLENLSIDDRKRRQDKELRLQELTASLDALTGGYFSRELGKGKV